MPTQDNALYAGLENFIGTGTRTPERGLTTTYEPGTDSFSDAETLRRRAWAVAASRNLFATDISKLDDDAVSGLYQATAKALFDIEDTDGTVAFGKKAGDARSNVDLLRRFCKGEYSVIRDPEYDQWSQMDEQRKFEYALEHETTRNKAKSYLNGERGAGLLENLSAGAQYSGIGLPPGAMAAARSFTGNDKLEEDARDVLMESARRSNYETLTPEEQAAYRADVIDDYEKKLSKRQTLATYLAVKEGLSDRASMLLAKAYNGGTVDVDAMESLSASERDRVYTALSIMRGDQKKGRILGIQTDFTDDTNWNRVQLGLYGLQQAGISLFSDTAKMAGNAATWTYGKCFLGGEERKRFFDRWDAENRAAAALEQGLPDASGAFGEGFQSLMENIHWFIPYGMIGKGGKLMRAAAGVAEDAAWYRKLAVTFTPWKFGANEKALVELNAAGKAVAEAKHAKSLADLTALDAISGAGKWTEGNVLLARQAATVEHYTKALEDAQKAVRAAKAAGQAGEALYLSGQAMAFSSFANEYVSTCDAAGISREDSVPMAAAIGWINAKIESIYVPGLESGLTKSEIKSLMFTSLLQAVRTDGMAGARKWLANRVAYGVREGVKVGLVEGAVEEPLQQIVIEHGKAIAATSQKLRENGQGDLADELLAYWDATKETAAQDLKTFIDTAVDMVPSSVAFGLTTIGHETRRQHFENYMKRREGYANYDAGVADIVARATQVQRMIREHWDGTGATPGSEKLAADPNGIVKAVTAARKAWNEGTGDTVQEIADAAMVDHKTAEAMSDYFAAEAQAALGSPNVKNFVAHDLSAVDFSEGTLAKVLPGYVAGSFVHDEAQGLYAGKVKLPNGEEKTIAYVYGDISQKLLELAEEQSKIDSELGKSHDARVKAGTEGGKLWAEMDEADRYRAALRSANALATGAGVFEVTGADGKKITISADDVIYLSNGEFGKVGYGPMATMGTVRHETWHSIWRFTSSELSTDEKQKLAKALGIDVTADGWETELDEAMAYQFEQYASGNYVSHRVDGVVARFVDSATGKMIRQLAKIGFADEIKNPKTGKGYALADFYDAVIRGQLGTGRLGYVQAEAPTASAPTAEKRAPTSDIPVEVKPEETVAVETAQAEAAEATEPEAPPAPKVAHTLENPADASVPNERFYRVSAGDGVTLVGELVVSDASELKTSYKGNLSDPKLQNRGETDEGRSLVEKIAGSPDPLQVGTVQPRANNGFVWATPSGDVFIGNTRSTGVTRAYENGNGAAVEAHMREEAAKRGIEIPEGVKHPVVHFVLRKIESEGGRADIYDVVRLTNESVNRGMNKYEQAKNDADVLVGNGIIPGIVLDSEGDVDTAKSADAIGAFRQLTNAQGMIDENTDLLTEDGQERIKNAILAALLKDGSPALLSKLVTQAKHLDMENEKAAVMRGASEMMRLAAAKPQYDLRGPLAEALDYYADWRARDEKLRAEAGKDRRTWTERTEDGARKRGLTWAHHMGQGDMFRTPSPEARLIGDLLAASRELRSFDKEDNESSAGKVRAQKLIGDYLADYIQNADAANTETDDLFGTPPPTRLALMESKRGTRFSTVSHETQMADNPEYRAVYESFHNPDGTARPNWLKAPNGQPTKLTPVQYVQVRTPSFKEWFGDWEKKAEIDRAVEFALNGEPVVTLTGDEFAQTGNHDLVDRVADYYASIGGSVEHPELGTVIIDREGVKSSLGHGIGRAKAAAFAAVPDVIRKGLVFDRQTNWKGRGVNSCVLCAPIRIGGDTYVCEAIIEQKMQGKERRFYLHEVNLQSSLADTIKTPTGGASIGKPSRPVRSILAQSAAAAQGVSKVVDENGEPLVVHHGSKWNPLEEPTGQAVFRTGQTFRSVGAHFGTKSAAYELSEDRALRGWNTTAYYLNIKNPIRVNDTGYWTPNDVVSEVRKTISDFPWLDDWESIREELQRRGYDGFEYENAVEDAGSISRVVFSPSQIKSATDNTGAFSPANPDIRYSVVKTDTPQFKRWFAKSKVVDENGNPLVVYRGAPFNPTKQPEGKGVIRPESYFTADPEYANRYGETEAYYLRIEHPLDVRNPEDVKRLAEFYPHGYKIATGHNGALDWAEMSNFDLDELREKYPEYDGIILDEGGDPLPDGSVKYRGVSYVPFDGGAQVKSATANNGDFSENPDVRFSVVKTDTPQFKRWFGDSKMVDENGKPRVFYHGTSQWVPEKMPRGKAVFSDDYTGTGSGDVGFFGRGFYFAFTEGEARSYGRHVSPVYLKIENPFNYQKELCEWHRERDASGYADHLPVCINIAKKFPTIAKEYKAKWYEDFDENGNGGEMKEVALDDIVKEAERIFKQVEFKIVKVYDGAIGRDGGYRTFVKAEPYYETFNGHKYKNYKISYECSDEVSAKEKIAQVYEYLTKISFPNLTLPSGRDMIMGSDFSGELRKRGYDGIIQSEEGDEAVVFSSNQIKSATANTGAFSLANPDFRFSVVDVGDIAIPYADDLATIEKLNPENPRGIEDYILASLKFNVQMAEGGTADINEDTARHYGWSKVRGKLNRNLRRARAKAAAILEDILKQVRANASTSRRDIHGKGDKVWKCRLPFAIPVVDYKTKNVAAANVFDADVTVKDEGHGKFLYDISELKKNQALSQQLTQILRGQTNGASGTLSAKSAQQSDSIPQSGTNGQRVRASVAPQTIASAYPRLDKLSDTQLIAAAVASKMVFGKRGKLKNKYVNVNEVQRYVKALHPGLEGVEVSRLTQEVTRAVKEIGGRIKEDLARGVSESQILQHLPDRMRDVFEGEMAGAAIKGANIGAYRQRAVGKLEEKAAKIVEDAVAVQTGVETALLENTYGIDFSETIMALAENPYLKKDANGNFLPAPGTGSGFGADGEHVQTTAKDEREVSQAIKKAVDEIVKVSEKVVQDEERQKAERRPTERKPGESSEGGDIGDLSEGDLAVLATKRAGVDLRNPRQLALFIAELTRRWWVKKNNLALNAEAFRDRVALQFLRKTAANIYTKLVREITYSQSRDAATQAINGFENAPTLQGLLREMTYVGQLVNARKIRETQQEMCERLDAMLREKFGATGRFKADREELRRKVSAEMEMRARYMRHAMWLTPNAAGEEAQRLRDELDMVAANFESNEHDADHSRVLTENLRKLNILREFGALRYKPLGDIETALAYWDNALEGETDAIVRANYEREVRTKKAAELLARAFHNPKVKYAQEGGLLSSLGDYIQGHMSFTHLLRDMMRFASEEDAADAEKIVRWLELEIQKAGTRSTTEQRRHASDLAAAVKQIYQRDFQKVLAEFAKEDERFAPFMGEKDGIKVQPTKGRAIQLMVSLLQVGHQVEVQDPNDPKKTVMQWVGGYHDNIVKYHRENQAAQIAALLTPADLNLVKWIGQWYEANRQELSDECQALFGMGVYAETWNYFPVKMLLEKQGLEKGEAVGWTIFPKALTPRVRNERDFDTSADILQLFMSRMEESAQWKAHAKLGLEMRGIFGRSELQNAVIASHGNKANALMLGFITDTLSGHGAYDRSPSGVEYYSDMIRGWAALGALGGNVGVMFKQTTSIPAFGFEIGMVDTAKHMLTAFTPEGMAAMRKIFDSDERKNRWQTGNTEAVKNALATNKTGFLKKLMQKSMITNKFGDCVPGLVIGQGIYRDAIKRGMSEEDAMAYTWMMIERTQQSSRIENQTSFQRRAKLGRIIYQFLSTQQQYLQYEARAIRKVIANPSLLNAEGRKRWTELGRAALLNHFILSSAYFWMGQLYKRWLGQEPPEDELKDWTISCLLGPYGALFCAGFTCTDALNEWIKGPRYGGGSSVPSLSWVSNVLVRDPARIISAVCDEDKTFHDVLEEAAKFAADANAFFRDFYKILRWRYWKEPQ